MLDILKLNASWYARTSNQHICEALKYGIKKQKGLKNEKKNIQEIFINMLNSILRQTWLNLS